MNKCSLLALILAVSTTAADELPRDSRELQFFWVEETYRIGIDNDPAWNWHTIAHPEAPAFQAATPLNYYPPGVVTVRLHKSARHSGTQAEFAGIARAAIERAIQNFHHVPRDTIITPQPVTFGELSGWMVDFDSIEDGALQANRLFVARSRSGQIMTLTAATLPGKLEHLAPALERVWSNISFAPPASDSTAHTPP